MNKRALLLLPLLAAAPAALAADALRAGPAAAGVETRATLEDYDKLVEAYEAAVKAHRKQIQETEDLKERSQLRKNKPAKAFWTRFEALADGGEGRALLWMAGNLRDGKGLSSKELGPEMQNLYARLVDQHVGAEWFGEAISLIPKQKRYLGEDGVVSLLESIIGAKTGDEHKAHAMFSLGSLLRGGDEDEQRAAGERWLKKLIADFPKTRWATSARAQFISPDDLKPGKPAPDFFASTIDGHEFNLSDYKGKVVLVDFYGFW